MSASGSGSGESNIVKKYIASQPTYEESLRRHAEMLKRLSEELGENVSSLKEYQEKKFLKESQRRVNEGREAAWKAIPSHQKAAALEAGTKKLFGAWGIESAKPAYRTSTTSTVNTHKKRLANMQKAINNAKKEQQKKQEKQAEEQMKEIGNFLAAANNNEKRKQKEAEEQMKEIGNFLAAENVREIEEFLKEPNNTTKKPKQGGKRKTRRRQTKKKQTRRRA